LAQSIGLTEKWVNIKEELIEYIVDSYTSEAGVRSIKRYIEKIFLTLNLDKIYKRNKFKDNSDFEISKEMIIEILNNSNNDITMVHPKSEIGIINGLYATTNGNGGIIPIQIFNNNGNKTFEMKYTGTQGDVMKESVQCSFTASIEYLKRINYTDNINEYLDNNFKCGFHIHTPSTSMPKDGPSAGCAFTSAFISRILNRPINNLIGMTGEIELTGRITKIGGLNFKLIGAKKAGIKIVYVPYENENDLNDIKIKYPKLIDDNFNVKLFSYIDDIIDEILV
jgi:ATP-dependent Lon protease